VTDVVSYLSSLFPYFSESILFQI